MRRPCPISLLQMIINVPVIFSESFELYVPVPKGLRRQLRVFGKRRAA